MEQGSDTEKVSNDVNVRRDQSGNSLAQQNGGRLNCGDRIDGALAQLVERLVRNEKVSSSILLCSTIPSSS